ncbi:MAG: hypothetical protein J6126_03000 [Clostridia bacterium]|nr:hypothetical protein [Clostridia bacterium]
MTPFFIILIITALLFMPVTAGAECCFDVLKGKLYYGVYLFAKIKIVRGYVQLKKTTAEIKIGKKVKVFPYKKIFEDRKKFDIFFGFQLAELSLLLEAGKEEKSVLPLAAASAFSTAGSVILPVVKTRSPTTKLYCGAEVYENKNLLTLHFNVYILLNAVLLGIAVVKKLLENFINGKRQAK